MSDLRLKDFLVLFRDEANMDLWIRRGIALKEGMPWPADRDPLTGLAETFLGSCVYGVPEGDVKRVLGIACGLCESPIEQDLLAAMVLTPGERVRVAMGAGEYEFPGPPGDRPTTTILPQMPVDQYRIDFFVGYSPAAGSGKELRVAVECDGHEFHDRTKEQARRDRQRDRAVQSMGLRVYRFTGSELYADAPGCAAQLFAALQDEVAGRQPWGS